MRARAFLLLGQFLDALTFALFFTLVPATILANLTQTERNPIIAFIFGIGGVIGVVVVKLGLTLFVIYRDSKRESRPKFTGALMIVAAGSGYLGASFNLVALFTVLQII
jgi:hypothetical protein